MRNVVTSILVLCMLFNGSAALLAAEGGWSSSVGAPDVKASSDNAKPQGVFPRVTSRRGDLTVEIDGRSITLTRKQQRDMGLTRAAVRRVLRQMERDGFEGDQVETTYELQDRLYDMYPEAWEAVAQQNGVMSSGSGQDLAIDWDGLLAFLEALIPIIEKLLEIFSNFNFGTNVDIPEGYVAMQWLSMAA